MPTFTVFVARLGALLVATVAMLAAAAALLGTQPVQAAGVVTSAGSR